MKKTKDKIIEIILNTAEEVGVFMDYDGENDFDMALYFADSVSFISFVVSLEEALEIEFSEELLYIENYSSFKRIVDMIYEIM